MKSKYVLTGIFLFTFLISNGQNQAVDLTFTAVENLKYVMLDSVKVMNRTQGIQTMVYWPDTSITVEINPGDLMLCIGYTTIHYVGIPEAPALEHKPFIMKADSTTLSRYSTSAGSKKISIAEPWSWVHWI